MNQDKMRLIHAAILGMCLFAIVMTSDMLLVRYPLWVRALSAGALSGIIAYMFILYSKRKQHRG